jgi:hypothetical protein
MNILVVSATEFEVKPLLGFLGIALPTIGMNNANIDFEEKDITSVNYWCWHGKYCAHGGKICAY